MMVVDCYEIKSIADYIDRIKFLRNYGVNGLREEIELYFRGEPVDYGDLAGMPNIARDGWLDGDRESTLFRECERRMPREFANCKTAFEKLALMQHYGIRTRLLDITHDSLQALFFALYNDPKSKNDDSNDSVVLVYEIPQEAILNWHSDKASVISNIAAYSYDDLNVEAMESDIKLFNENESIHHLLHEIRAEKPYFLNEIVKDHLESVYCVHPLLDNPRIKAQQGAFLLFGIDGNKHHLATLETSKGPEIRLAKIRIPQFVKNQIREELEILGKTVDTVYPDWSGVSDYFNRFYNKNPEEYYKE